MGSKLGWQNWCQLTGTTVSALSSASAYPVNWLQDPLRSKTWRSKTGWTISSSFNNKLDFLEGTSAHKTATLTGGTYVSGTSMAAHIQTQMDAAATANTYTISYASNKFTLARATTSATLGLEWSTGANTAVSIGPCIGFNSTSDLTTVSSGTASYTAENVSYQSRQYIKFDFGADRDVDLAILHYHNIPTSNASINFQAHTSDVWTSPTIDQTMTIGDVAIKWPTSTLTYRYWRFVIDNTQTQTGYTYVGIPYLGEYLEPSPGLSHRFSEEYTELSEIGRADQGAPFQLEKDRGRSYRLVWPGLTTNEKNKIKNMAAFIKSGRPFFFSLDSDTNADDAVYVMSTRGISINNVAPSHWQVTMQVDEAIG